MRRDETYLGSDAYKTLSNKKVAIVGVGALGCSISLLIAKLGVKQITLIDRDIVEEFNLSTQLLYTKEDVNKSKVEVAKEKLSKITSSEIVTFDTHLDYTNINTVIKDVDIIIDATDNLHTRFLLNDYSKKFNIPLVYNAVIRNKGYCMVVSDNACLQCMIPKEANPKTCFSEGVFQPIIGLISAYAVNQTVNALLEKLNIKTLFYANLETDTFKQLRTVKNPICRACNGKFDYLSGKKTQNMQTHCGGKSFLFYKRDKTKGVKRTKEYTDFGDKVIVYSDTKSKALSLFNREFGEFKE